MLIRSCFFPRPGKPSFNLILALLPTHMALQPSTASTMDFCAIDKMQSLNATSMSSSPDSGYYSQSNCLSEDSKQSSHLSQIQVPGLDFQWTLHEAPLKTHSNQTSQVRFVHVSVKRSEDSLGSCVENWPQYHIQDLLVLAKETPVSRPVNHFLTNLAQHLSETPTSNLDIAYVLPYASGWMVRSDFLEIRLRDLPGLQNVESFSEPLQYYRVPEPSDSDRSGDHELLDSAVGAMTFKMEPFTTKNIAHLQDHLVQRLDYPWLSSEPIVRKRVALVRGRPNLEIGWRIYQAARALGVALLIIDDDGHWLQEDTESNKLQREAFIPIDMNSSDLPDRIAEAIEAYPLPIHGLFTVSDNFLVPVAKAAEKLGLPTSPSLAHEVAVDKHLTRGLQAKPTQFARVASETVLQQLIEAGQFIPSYPLIVKPRVGGWSSEYVYKAQNMEQLIQHTQKICNRYAGGTLIEPYYDGPEIDVNFIMLNGRPLYREIVDETPSKGDLDNTSSADFLESGMILPTILPQEEKDIIYDSILDILQKLGFLTGVFHVEARISRSRMEYRNIDDTIDLVDKETVPTDSVRCHLIEINARCPGLVSEILTSYTCGVDYFAARILSAIDDPTRLEAVSHPFSNTGYPDGSQYWSQLIFPPIQKGGVVLTSDPMKDLVTRSPDLAQHISDARCDFKQGSRLPDPEKVAAAYMGHFLVTSRKGRSHMMKTADKIRAEFGIEEL